MPGDYKLVKKSDHTTIVSIVLGVTAMLSLAGIAIYSPETRPYCVGAIVAVFSFFVEAPKTKNILKEILKDPNHVDRDTVVRFLNDLSSSSGSIDTSNPSLPADSGTRGQ